MKWYVVPGVTDLPFAGESSVGGIWYPQGDRIVLADGQQLAGDLVRHEMLHALLETGGHPRSAFIDRCEGTVVCFNDCLGPAPPPDPHADTVSPSTFQIQVDVTPSAPSSQLNDGNFMMIVTVTNTAPSPVIAKLPASADGAPPVAYSYEISGNSGRTFYSLPADYPEMARFSEHQVKHFIFDFHIVQLATDNRYEVSPGTYTFTGGFAGVNAANSQVVAISP